MKSRLIVTGQFGLCVSEKEYNRMMRIRKKLHEDEISRTRASEADRQRNEFVGRKIRGGNY